MAKSLGKSSKAKAEPKSRTSAKASAKTSTKKSKSTTSASRQNKTTKTKVSAKAKKSAALSKKTYASANQDRLRGQIAERAYYIYAERGFTPGDERADWLQAEQEVLTQLKKS